MRYMIVSKGAPLDKIEKELLRHGATNIRRHEHVDQVSCDLDEKTAQKLSAIPGIKVQPVRVMKPLPMEINVQSDVLPAALPTPQQEADLVTTTFAELRAFYSPQITGVGLTVAVLDTGIRKTHNALGGRVVYEYNATDSPGVEDVWGHGTGVAYLICGQDGDHIGVSPGAVVMNIKVINDDGIATTETLVEGINKVVELVKSARFDGRSPLDPMYPNCLNISIGGEDTGDEDDPIRVACRKASIDYDTDVIAAAGNAGPTRSTIMVPAADPAVVAVGGTEIGSVFVWEQSSRGPTELGDTKPDFMAWGTSITVASHKSDTGYDTKSGTSFSCPILSGMTGLLWETARMNLPEVIAPLYVFRWSQIKEYAPYFCVKPADAAAVKDNTYGYGSPAGGIMIQQMSQPTGGTEQFMEQMPMLIMMAMMAGLVA